MNSRKKSTSVSFNNGQSSKRTSSKQTRRSTRNYSDKFPNQSDSRHELVELTEPKSPRQRKKKRDSSNINKTEETIKKQSQGRVYRQQKFIQRGAEVPSQDLSYKKESVFYRQVYQNYVWYYNFQGSCRFVPSQLLDCCCQTACLPILMLGQWKHNRIQLCRYPCAYCCYECMHCNCQDVAELMRNSMANLKTEGVCCCVCR